MNDDYVIYSYVVVNNLRFIRLDGPAVNTIQNPTPYVIYGCTNNWDFRTVSSVGVTDSIGGIDVTYEPGISFSNAGSSTVTDGFYTKIKDGATNGHVETGMKIGNGFSFGGTNFSIECYLNITEWQGWSRLFRWLHSDAGSNYFENSKNWR